jgi:cytosine/adenosine deaminase-related metal-dependent hydrolase
MVILAVTLGTGLALAGCLDTVGALPDGGIVLPDVPGDMTPGGPLYSCPAPPPRPMIVDPTQVSKVGDPTRLLLRGRVVTPDDVLVIGQVLISAGMIVCVAPDCSGNAEAQGATEIDTGGVIFPGLVDAHNHTQFNYLPPWTPPFLFTNRYQWQARGDYRMHVTSVNDNEATYVCQQVKYGELRALIGGTTTMQGTFSNSRKCFRTLVRNAEYGDLGEDKMRTHVGNVSDVMPYDAQDLVDQLNAGDVTAYVIHLAEGIDDLSRSELTTLDGLGLLRKETVIIHGTALGTPELQKVAAAGAKLVWSPLSNLALYGQTTNVPLARSMGIPVALAPDWTPSGSASLLGELKVARDYDCSYWGSTLDNKTLVQMVTSIPADAMALGGQIGRLAPGKVGDVLVIADRGEDAYDTLINATLSDVRLVVIGGDVRYGDAGLESASPRPATTGCEAMSICGQDKFLCVPENTDGTDTLNQTAADITAAVQSFYATPYTFEVCDQGALP